VDNVIIGHLQHWGWRPVVDVRPPADDSMEVCVRGLTL
jgi:hypothetical protein